MVKLDVSLLRYLSKEDLRVLTSVEMGMRNHELVPGTLVGSIASLKHGGISKHLQELCKHKLLAYERGKRFDGYRLTCLGYDYLALNVLKNRDIVSRVGSQIGVGKESDVYVAANDEGTRFALKIHRLGRTCFRNVHNKRDYHRPGKKIHNWIYMSRLAAIREFAFMKALHEKGFPVPRPVECNRHCIIMELIEGTLLNGVSPDSIPEPAKLYEKLLNLMISLANDYGVVHGDFNEFNLMIKPDTNEPVLIDFPQMVATSHKYAASYFERDVKCIVDFFNKKFNFTSEFVPSFENDVTVDGDGNDLITKVIKEQGIESLEIESDEDGTENGEDEADEGEDDDEEVGEDVYEEASEEFPVEEAQQETGGEPVAFVSVVEDNEEDDGSEMGCATYSVSGSVANYSTTSRSTFAPEEIKSRLRKEKQKQAKVKEIKNCTKNVKGDEDAVRRKRKEDLIRIKDDLKVHAVEPF